jgi:predicted transcriptional regulator
MSPRIHVSEDTWDRLAAIAASTGESMSIVAARAVETFEQRMFFDRFNERYREIRDDAVSWGQIEAERRLEEGAIGDTCR